MYDFSFDMDIAAGGLVFENPGLMLNGEMGKHIADSSRWIYKFESQDLIAKVEWFSGWQSETEVDIIQNTIDPMDDIYFPDIMHHGFMKDYLEMPRRFEKRAREGAYFIVQPFYDFVHAGPDCDCSPAIIANKLANKYSIGDWGRRQWGIVDNLPIIFDVGITSNWAGYELCHCCGTAHAECRDWSDL